MKSLRTTFFATFALVAALVAAPASANPIVAPSVSYTVGESSTNVELTRDGKQYAFNYGVDTPDYLLTMSGMLDPDPLISFLFNVTNMTNSAQQFTLSFSLPFSETLLAGTGESSLSGLVTEDASLTATGPSMLTVRLNGNDVGLDVGPDYDTLDMGFYGPYNGGPVSLVGPYSQMTATLSFMLSAGASAELNGSVLITPVPEPATLTLLGLALCTVAARRRPRA